MELLNLREYTASQLGFYAAGAYPWVVAYLIYIRNGTSWVPICLFVFASSAAFYGTFVLQGLDVGSTIQSAYICQMPISFLYIPLLLKQTSLTGWSFAAGWARTLGTGLIGVFAFMRYPDHPFLLTMAVIATVVDSIYLHLFIQHRRALAKATQPVNMVGAPTLVGRAP